MGMELDDLLNALDRASANLAKLDAVWSRAASFMPQGPAAGSDPEYDDLARAWEDLLPGLPPIDGWTITDELPDIDAIGRAFIDYFEIGEHPFGLYEDMEKPGKDLAQYRYRLNRTRRRAARERLQHLTALVDTMLPHVLASIPRDSTNRVEGDEIDRLVASFAEIDRLIGDTAQRRGRWSDLHRHLRFSEGHDWHDVYEFDWPTIKPDIEAGSLSDTDPIPVPEFDLGQAAAGRLTGAASTALRWDQIGDDTFERLLYDLLREFPEHENVTWLTKTRAPDRGRDLALDRVLRDGTGGVRHERVIVQAKHWLSKSVGLAEIAANVAAVKLWQPPVVRGLLIVTSGRFSSDAVAWVEQHNDSAVMPHIDLWPESRLETLLAQRPHLVAAHGLR